MTISFNVVKTRLQTVPQAAELIEPKYQSWCFVQVISRCCDPKIRYRHACKRRGAAKAKEHDISPTSRSTRKAKYPSDRCGNPAWREVKDGLFAIPPYGDELSAGGERPEEGGEAEGEGGPGGGQGGVCPELALSNV